MELLGHYLFVQNPELEYIYINLSWSCLKSCQIGGPLILQTSEFVTF